ncbi:hypothetical protein [Snodgrassella alvi]|uniref:Uncharacterized protein n=1 Tax=Snodgrassella alvi TaxID=1196083 RepID=A0A2N9XYS3_9NEIS|nr:hypothetical protein [Snodgrassella alvi]PIT56072.1 hypothetical protein BHC49_04880 [Snodgrassella alvi]
MGMLLKVYKHNGWCYVRPLGNISPHPVASFPFGRAQYQNSTAWQDKITGRYVMPKNKEMRDTFNPIHGSDEGLLVNSYKTVENEPSSSALTSSYESILYGNALTIRVKPGQFAGFPLILCVLYGEKGDYDRDELLIIAIQDLQIVTYYRKRNAANDDVTKNQTGIYLNDNDRWSSIGLNFSSSNGFGLAGIYHKFTYHKLNIVPLKEFRYFWLFDFNTDTWVEYEDEKDITPFNGGVAQAKVYSNALTYPEFDALLDEYNDNDDRGVIYIDKPSGGVLAKIYTETKEVSNGGNNNGGNPPPSGNGGSGGNGTGGNNDNKVDIGGSGDQDPLKPGTFAQINLSEINCPTIDTHVAD